MRGQPLIIAALIGLMGALRFGLAAFGYAAPEMLMDALGAPMAANVQSPYIVRVWAVRDMVLAVLVLSARMPVLRTLLVACIVIDCTDILSAVLAGRDGLFDVAGTYGLMTTAVAALVPEVLALLLIHRQRQADPR